MFENKTFENIMADMLSRVPNNLDKREGSVIWDALAPAAAEIAGLYISMDAVLSQTFADTASVDYLARRASERGISRLMATKAVLKAVFTPSALDIAVGSRFSCDRLNYIVTEKISAGEYRVECETAGTEGNLHLGQLIPIDYIAGLETAELTEVLIPARDDETAEELRKRYFDAITSLSYGGNIADYKEKTLAIDGVGAVKVRPAYPSAGNVTLVVLDSTFSEPSDELLDDIKETFDPTGAQSGKGYGIAPIGHTVIVEGGEAKTVNIVSTISYQSGWSWASAKTYIKAAVDEYFRELSEAWQESDALVVRISVLESRILAAEGVLDITGTTLNGSAANLQCGEFEIPVRGTINGES